MSLANRKPYSYTIEGIIADVMVEFDEKPQIKAGGTISGVISVTNKAVFPEQKQYSLRYFCPEGWTVESPLTAYSYLHSREAKYNYNKVPFTIHAGEHVEAVNEIVLQVSCPGRPTRIFVPIQIMG